LAENTLVIYTTDNGWIQRLDSPQFAPRSKRSRYDGGVRTPVMVRWPGRVQPARDEHTLVSNVDIVPTVLGATGGKSTPAMQGVNLLDRGGVRRRRAVFGAVYTHDAVDVNKPLENLQNLWAVEREWKLILPCKRAEENVGPELYNVLRDPHENDNLATKHPGHVARLRARIRQWWPEGAGTSER
jgi:uncharacterized sulfatase